MSTGQRSGRLWLIRIALLAAVVAVTAGIGLAVRKGHAGLAILLLFTVPVIAYLLSRNWTESLFTSFEWAKRYVEGVEGDHRHEWYAFRGERVRVFLDDMDRPWFALNEIAFILGVEDDEKTFRHYAPHEYGIPGSASEHCLSERGLRRLLKSSTHPEAGALEIWLEREVLRVLRKSKGVSH